MIMTCICKLTVQSFTGNWYQEGKKYNYMFINDNIVSIEGLKTSKDQFNLFFSDISEIRESRLKQILNNSE